MWNGVRSVRATSSVKNTRHYGTAHMELSPLRPSLFTESTNEALLARQLFAIQFPAIYLESIHANSPAHTVTAPELCTFNLLFLLHVSVNSLIIVGYKKEKRDRREFPSK